MGFVARLAFAVTLTIAAFAAAPGRALEPGDDQFPNSIMAPEPGTAGHRHATGSRHTTVRNAPPTKSLTLPRTGVHLYARGSSGSVLPTPLPRTQLIPPEGGGAVTIHPAPQEQGATIVPGAPGLGAVPNLSHGPETFQDRASRCALQQGLNNVPGGASNAYMGACIQ